MMILPQASSSRLPRIWPFHGTGRADFKRLNCVCKNCSSSVVVVSEHISESHPGAPLRFHVVNDSAGTYVCAGGTRGDLNHQFDRGASGRRFGSLQKHASKSNRALERGTSLLGKPYDTSDDFGGANIRG